MAIPNPEAYEPANTEAVLRDCWSVMSAPNQQAAFRVVETASTLGGIPSQVGLRLVESDGYANEETAIRMANDCLEKLEACIDGTQKKPEKLYFNTIDLLHNMAHQHFLHQAAQLPGAQRVSRIDFERPGEKENGKPFTVLYFAGSRVLLRATPHRYAESENTDPGLFGKLHGITYDIKRMSVVRSLGRVLGFKLR